MRKACDETGSQITADRQKAAGDTVKHGLASVSFIPFRLFREGGSGGQEVTMPKVIHRHVH